MRAFGQYAFTAFECFVQVIFRIDELELADVFYGFKESIFLRLVIGVCSVEVEHAFVTGDGFFVALVEIGSQHIAYAKAGAANFVLISWANAF